MSNTPPHIRRYTACFDTPIKTAAVKQFMEQNCASFDEATSALNYNHGVDFLFFCDDSEGNWC